MTRVSKSKLWVTGESVSLAIHDPDNSLELLAHSGNFWFPESYPKAKLQEEGYTDRLNLDLTSWLPPGGTGTHRRCSAAASRPSPPQTVFHRRQSLEIQEKNVSLENVLFTLVVQ